MMIFKYFLLFTSFLMGLPLLAMEQPRKGIKRLYFDLNNPDVEFSYSEYPDTGITPRRDSEQDFLAWQEFRKSIQPMPEASPANSAQNSTLSPLPFLNQPIETASQGLNQTASSKKQQECAVCGISVLNLNLHEKTSTHKKNIKHLMQETKNLTSQIRFKELCQEYAEQSDYTDTDTDTEVYNPIMIPCEFIEDKTSAEAFDGAHFLNTLYAMTAQYRELSMATEQTSNDMDHDGDAKKSSSKIYARKSGLGNPRKFTFSIIGQQRAQSNTQSSVSTANATKPLRKKKARFVCNKCDRSFLNEPLYRFHIEAKHQRFQ